MGLAGVAQCRSCGFSGQVETGPSLTPVETFSLSCPTCRDIIMGRGNYHGPASRWAEPPCPVCWGPTENLDDDTETGLCPMCLERTLWVSYHTLLD